MTTEQLSSALQLAQEQREALAESLETLVQIIAQRAGYSTTAEQHALIDARIALEDVGRPQPGVKWRAR